MCPLRSTSSNSNNDITQNQGKNSGPAFSASLELTNPFHETELVIPTENIRKSEVSRGI